MIFNNKKILTALSCILLLASGCTIDEKISPEMTLFASYSDYGVYVGGQPSFVYDKYTHQYSKGIDGTNMFRLQTDNQSNMFMIEMAEAPAKGNELETLVTTSGYNAIDAGTICFRVVSAENGIFRLWNEELKIGVIIPV